MSSRSTRAEGVAVGDRVIVKMRHGAYSDEAVATPSQLVTLPSTFDYAEGATFLAGHGTAYHALIDRGRLQPGEVLLVHGAGGGVGLAAVEIGKMLGATVIATASSDEKLAIAKARGADHLVRYDREPFRDAVKRITDGQGADVVFDPVGGEVFENSDALHQLGRAAAGHRLYRRHRACQDQSADDQGRQRARRPRRRSGAEKSRARRSQDQGADGMGGSRERSAPTSRIGCRWKITPRRCGC